MPVFGQDFATEVGRRYGAPVQMMQLNHGIFDEASISVIAFNTGMGEREGGREEGREGKRGEGGGGREGGGGDKASALASYSRKVCRQLKPPRHRDISSGPPKGNIWFIFATMATSISRPATRQVPTASPWGPSK